MTKASLSPVKKTAAPAPQADSQATESSGPLWKTQSNCVQGAIWKHDQKDKARYTIAISRSYKEQSGKWVSTHFFDQQDLKDVRAVRDLAPTEILGLEHMMVAVGED